MLVGVTQHLVTENTLPYSTQCESTTSKQAPEVIQSPKASWNSSCAALRNADVQGVSRSARSLLAYQKPASSLTESLSKPQNGKVHAESCYKKCVQSW